MGVSKTVAEAVALMGPGALTEAALQQHVRPLFSRTLAMGTSHLANHTLGRMLDQTTQDIAEGLAVWAERQRDAWEPWLAEEARYRASLAGLLGLAQADGIVPKASAGQALRAVLNSLPYGSTVVATRGEFASVTVILEQYAAMGRLQVEWVSPDEEGCWTVQAFDTALARCAQARLVVCSLVFYADGQLFAGMAQLSALCRSRDAELLVDAYHAVGALPVSLAKLECDYMIGGCYKYLRGGPGAAFLAIAPHLLPGLRRTADVGWYAQVPGTGSCSAGNSQPPAGGPQLLAGGDGWLDGTPAVLPYYQARSGLALTRALGVERIRAYSLQQSQTLRELLAERGMASGGGDDGHGAFVTVPSRGSDTVVASLAAQGIVIDATQGRLRICPDVLTTREELVRAADALAAERR